MTQDAKLTADQQRRQLSDHDIIVQAEQALAVDSTYAQYRVLPTGAVAVEENQSDQQQAGTPRQVGGAAVVGGVAGLLLAGPIVGLVAAGGAAALATTKGKAGKVARSSGEVAASAGDRLKKFDQKHKVVQKTANGIEKGCNWMSKKLQPKNQQSNNRNGSGIIRNSNTGRNSHETQLTH